MYITGTANSDLAVQNSEASGSILFASGGGVEHMRLSAAGNVGIGTINPTAPLHVIGLIRSGGSVGGLQVTRRDTSADAWQWYSASGNLQLYDNAGAVDRLTITSAGHVGVNVSPGGGGKFQSTAGTNQYAVWGAPTTAGYGGVIGYSQDSNSFGILGHANAYGVYAATTVSTGVGVFGSSSLGHGVEGVSAGASVYGVVAQNSNANGYGILGQNTSNGNYCILGGPSFAITCSGASGGTGAWTTSDKRLKKDIKPLDSSEGLETVMKLNPVHFHWKNDNLNFNQEGEMGFIAQEVESVMPSIVREMDQVPDPMTHKAEFKTIKTLQYDRMVAPLVLAIQQFKQLFDADHDTLGKLKADNDNLRAATEKETAQINALRADVEALKAAAHK